MMYDPDELLRTLPPVPTTANGSRASPKSRTGANATPRTTSTLTPSELPPDFLPKLRDVNPDLADRIETEDNAADAGAIWRDHDPARVDRSANDFYIACELLRLKESPASIAAVFMHPVWFSGSRYREDHRTDYINLTIQKAQNAVTTEQQQSKRGRGRPREEAPTIDDMPWYNRRNGAAQQLTSAQYTLASAIEPKEQDWLWKGRIPLGTLTVMDGDPGLGKSQLTALLAAYITTGREIPYGGGTLTGKPSGVLIISAEDNAETTIVPRLELAGADRSRVALEPFAKDKDNGKYRLLRLSDYQAIAEIIDAIEAKFMIVDPLISYLGPKVDSHRDQSVREVLDPLMKFAEWKDIAILGLRHFKKDETGTNALYRGGGSIGIIGGARSAMAMLADKEDEDRRTLVMTKANLYGKVSALQLYVPNVEDGMTMIQIEGEVDTTVDDLLDEEVMYTSESAKSIAAADFLDQVLADGPQPATEVYAMAKQPQNNFGKRTLDEAKKFRKVKSLKRGSAWWWHRTGCGCGEPGCSEPADT